MHKNMHSGRYPCHWVQDSNKQWEQQHLSATQAILMQIQSNGQRKFRNIYVEVKLSSISVWIKKWSFGTHAKLYCLHKAINVQYIILCSQFTVVSENSLWRKKKTELKNEASYIRTSMYKTDKCNEKHLSASLKVASCLYGLPQM